MKQGIRRLTARLTLMVFMLTLIPAGLLAQKVSAADQILMSVKSYAAGNVVIQWGSLPVGTQSLQITWNEPDPVTNAASAKVLNPLLTDKSASMTGLLDNYIYEYRLRAYSGAAATGAVLGDGVLFFMSQMSFQATTVNVAPVNPASGGRESGNAPETKLQWNEPFVYNGTNFSKLSASLGFVQSELNSVLASPVALSTLNYRINMTTNLMDMSGATAMNITTADNSAYTAAVSNAVAGDKVDVTNSGGRLSYHIIGRASATEAMPALIQASGRLPHPDVLPGTVFYMEIKPSVRDAGGSAVSFLSVGDPSTYGGSMVKDTSTGNRYTYMPIRFNLTKDDMDNIYVKIYKINQGSLDLPRLYYEVQASDDPSVPGDWPVKKTMDDTYFNGEFATTVITGINANNTIYYRIVVKSDSPTDRIESLKMDYVIAQDINKPVVPKNLVVDAVTSGEIWKYKHPVTDDHSYLGSDLRFRWDRPSNWDQILSNSDPDKDIYYYIDMGTTPTPVTTNDPPRLTAEGEYYGSYNLKFRMIRYMNARVMNLDGTAQDADGVVNKSVTLSNGDIFRVDGTKLEYIVSGRNAAGVSADEDLNGGLFTGVTLNAAGTAPGYIALPNDEGAGNPVYPTYFLPNKTYYLRMRSAMGTPPVTVVDNLSDYSLVTSATTLPGKEQDTPIVRNFTIASNTTDVTGGVLSNTVGLQFDQLTVDWARYGAQAAASKNVYYDLFMSSRSDGGYTCVGSTDPAMYGGTVNADPDKGAAFTLTDPSKIFVTLRKFESGFFSWDPDGAGPATPVDPYARFGAKLRPNTTYYYYVKTRIVIGGEADRVSVPTAILPVTTLRSDIVPPDEEERIPLAPDDFRVAVDASGNQLITSTDITFDWTRKEQNVRYTLICTQTQVPANGSLTTYVDDPLFMSFNTKFGNRAVEGLSLMNLSPADIGSADFTYDTATKLLTLSRVKSFLFPNTQYWFSLRAEVWDAADSMHKTSGWISIPVTTDKIEGPTGLETQVFPELGFNFTDADPLAKPEDYTVWYRKTGDYSFSALTSSKVRIIKDGTTVYVRMFSMTGNSTYDVRVTRGTQTVDTPTYSTGTTPLATRNVYNQLEVRWKGLTSYNYELAVRPVDETLYTTLQSQDIVITREKTLATLGTDYWEYHALIKSYEVTLPTGVKDHPVLRANMKYDIKVRAVKTDFADITMRAYSKYNGPVQARTEFRQSDYDQTELDTQKAAMFTDRMENFEKKPFWRLYIDQKDKNSVLLKGDQITSQILDHPNGSVVVDLTGSNTQATLDTVYAPMSVLKAMADGNTSLDIRTKGGKVLLRPDSVASSGDATLVALMKNTLNQDAVVKLSVGRSAVSGQPSSVRSASQAQDIKVTLTGLRLTEKSIKDLVKDKVYNKDTGLFTQQKAILLNPYVSSGVTNGAALEKYVDQLVGEVERQLSSYLGSVVDGNTAENRSIAETARPMVLSLNYDDSISGRKSVWNWQDASLSWNRMAVPVNDENGSLRLEMAKPAKVAVMSESVASSSLPAGSTAARAWEGISKKYDMMPAMGGSTYFDPATNMTVKDLLMAYTTLSGKTVDPAADLKTRTRLLGLDDLLGGRAGQKDISRQELSAVFARLYAVRNGISEAEIRPAKIVRYSDSQLVTDKYRPAVALMLSLGVLSVQSGEFSPTANVPREHFIIALSRLLTAMGEGD